MNNDSPLFKALDKSVEDLTPKDISVLCGMALTPKDISALCGMALTPEDIQARCGVALTSEDISALCCSALTPEDISARCRSALCRTALAFAEAHLAPSLPAWCEGVPYRDVFDTLRKWCRDNALKHLAIVQVHGILEDIREGAIVPARLTRALLTTLSDELGAIEKNSGIDRESPIQELLDNLSPVQKRILRLLLDAKGKWVRFDTLRPEMSDTNVQDASIKKALQRLANRLLDESILLELGPGKARIGQK